MNINYVDNNKMNSNNIKLFNIYGANPDIDNMTLVSSNNISFKHIGKNCSSLYNCNPPDYLKRYWLLRTDNLNQKDIYHALNYKNNYYNRYNDPNEY